MAAINFPSSPAPTVGQNFAAGNGVNYVWNGSLWSASSSVSPDTVRAVIDLAALKGLTTRPNVVVVETGRAMGEWRWQAAATDTADDAVVVTPSGTPTGRYKRLYEAGHFNAAWYGALGDNTTDNTVALQAVITAAEAYTVAGATTPIGVGGLFGTVHVPAGVYVTGALAITKPIRVRGESRTATVLKLKNASNNHLFTSTVTPLSWFAPNAFEDFTIDGNRTNQTGLSCGIYLATTSWPIATNYSLGCHLNNVAIHNCRDAGLYIGANRNDGNVNECLIYNCGASGVENHAFDWRFYASDIGVNAYGYTQAAGGGLEMWGCNVYQNTTNAVIIGESVTSYMYFNSCSLDSSGQTGVYIDGNGQLDVTYSFIQCHFTRNSGSAHNTYPDIQLIDANGVLISSCTFRRLDTVSGVRKPSYLVLFGGTSGQISWQANHYLSIGDVPWGTALTNDFNKLVIIGQQPLVTAGSLPSPTNRAGMRAMVSDATVATFVTVVVGGGANVVPVYCNGGGWVIG